MKGRKPKPAEVREAQGNPGHRPMPTAAHDVPGLKASAPKGLPVAARRIWEELAPELGRMKLLRTTDFGAFSRYCEHLARSRPSRWWKLGGGQERRRSGRLCGW